MAEQQVDLCKHNQTGFRDQERQERPREAWKYTIYNMEVKYVNILKTATKGIHKSAKFSTKNITMCLQTLRA